ncbi:MAG: hemerythrin domain-containing protein [Chloroflexi bacterium]|nr:hemerythrin domain-containing protein [Chloroflexota bacterium]
MVERQGLIQFFQHAHHRVEGHLMDFQESLEQGLPDQQLFGLAVAELRQHMFAEEELLFPQIRHRLAGSIASLEEEHGHVWDLAGEVGALLGQGGDPAQVRPATARLMSLLAAHCAEEDLGIYSELEAILGPDRAWALMLEAEKATPPEAWACSARRGAGIA